MFGSSLLMAATASTSYTIANSARFRSAANTYLSRTPSVAGNRQKFTISCWVKRVALATTQRLFGVFGGSSDTDWFSLHFDSSDRLTIGGGATSWRVTTAVYRDPNAWYHIVAALDTTTQTVSLYVNGVQVTAWTTNVAITANLQTAINNTGQHTWSPTTSGLNCYLSECYLIDGSALTPSSFGQTDANGVWVPKAPSGLTYGTNGVRLQFGTAAALGTDTSGNGNTYTANGFTAANSGFFTWKDQSTDTPTDNAATWNALVPGSGTLSRGNLYSVNGTVRGTIGMRDSGKYFWEIGAPGAAAVTAGLINDAGTTYTVSVPSGSGYALRFDAGTGVLQWSNDGSSFTNISTGLTSGPYYLYATSTTDIHLNNGAMGGGTYFTKTAGYTYLSTANLPAVTVAKGASYHNSALYTGNGSTLAVAGLGFRPGLLWLKNRGVAVNHILVNDVVGATSYMNSNSTAAESTNSQVVKTIDSDGFTVGDGAPSSTTNATSNTYVGWAWRAGASSATNNDGSVTSTVSVNPTAGFSIATYTAPSGAAHTVGHGLGAAPKMVIWKPRTGTLSWFVYHDALGASYYVTLETNGVRQAAGTTTWGNPATAPSSTVVTIGSGLGVNTTVVMYSFAEIVGYSKFGSFTGNGSADGPFVNCGFRPRFIMTRRTDAAGEDWNMIDTTRDPYNVANHYLFADGNSAELSVTMFDVTANGFKIRGTSGNTNTGTYIYAAFAENPFGGSNVAPCTAR